MPVRARPVTAEFPGAACPMGSRVRFVRRGQRVSGTVAELQQHHATIVDGEQRRLRVRYSALEVVERAGRQHTLAEVEALATELLDVHKSFGGLHSRWRFGFDLSPMRAGVCRHGERRIDLSVSYCLQAELAEIADTVLHEIAHAIVGPAHHHDAVWRAKAREIGCSGERTHDVQHTVARWVGECGCGVLWYRQRLHRRLKKGARCPSCMGAIAWRANNGMGGGEDTGGDGALAV